MHIKSIHVENFMAHDERDFELPARGIVIISGANGVGKSSIVEAVSTAFWGDTLRGSSPWRSGERGLATVVTDRHVATRSITRGGRKALAWHRGAEMAAVYATTSKGQEALEAEVGSLDRWRRTHVFSSHDAAHFTSATDGQRKRMLEQLLDLGRFDTALERCRAELSAARKRAQTAEAAMGRAQVAFELRAAELAAHDAEEAEPEPVAPLKNQSCITPEQLESAERQLAVELEDLRMRREELQAPTEHERVAAVAEARLAEAKRHHAELSERCPTCGQVVPFEDRERLRAVVAELEKTLQDARTARDERWEYVHAQAELLAAQGASCAQQRADLVAARAELTAWEVVNARWRADHAAWSRRRGARASKRADIARAFAAAELELGGLEDELASQARRVAELEAVEKVLGLRGVRAQLLGQALAAIEVVANAWLGRVAQRGMRLELRPYTEKKSGGVSDAIGLEVHGAGGGLGYKASSGGERRRIDVALLLALSDISDAASASSPGTLFLDELFDSLDADGIEAVVGVLDELATDRAVVVITHSQELACKLPAATRWML